MFLFLTLICWTATVKISGLFAFQAALQTEQERNAELPDILSMMTSSNTPLRSADTPSTHCRSATQLSISTNRLTLAHCLSPSHARTQTKSLPLHYWTLLLNRRIALGRMGEVIRRKNKGGRRAESVKIMIPTRPRGGSVPVGKGQVETVAHDGSGGGGEIGGDEVQDWAGSGDGRRDGGSSEGLGRCCCCFFTPRLVLV